MERRRVYNEGRVDDEVGVGDGKVIDDMDADVVTVCSIDSKDDDTALIRRCPATTLMMVVMAGR